jgi:hypothetical protein
MAWCLVKHRDNFTFTIDIYKHAKAQNFKVMSDNIPILEIYSTGKSAQKEDGFVE